MAISWADALEKAITSHIELPHEEACKVCPLCSRAETTSRGCEACPCDGDTAAYIYTGTAEGPIFCMRWGRAIADKNRTAIKRARQLAAFVRANPMTWQHMDPADLAREVKKVKL